MRKRARAGARTSDVATTRRPIDVPVVMVTGCSPARPPHRQCIARSPPQRHLHCRARRRRSGPSCPRKSIRCAGAPPTPSPPGAHGRPAKRPARDARRHRARTRAHRAGQQRTLAPNSAVLLTRVRPERSGSGACDGTQYTPPPAGQAIAHAQTIARAHSSPPPCALLPTAEPRRLAESSDRYSAPPCPAAKLSRKSALTPSAAEPSASMAPPAGPRGRD
jgi:hypothetical protein